MEDNLFDLTEEQESTSKMMYDGKIIKCLVAPYHSFDKLKEIVKFTKTTYLFPEREMSTLQVRQFISMIVANKNIVDEVRIVTTSQNIIMDMVDVCVRVLTEGGDIVESPVKTFMANIHDIRYSLLENKDHQISDEEREKGRDIVTELIDQIKNSKETGMNKEDYNALIVKIKVIGEPIIANQLMNMADDIEVTYPEGENPREELFNQAQAALDAGDIQLASSIMQKLERMS